MKLSFVLLTCLCMLTSCGQNEADNIHGSADGLNQITSRNEHSEGREEPKELSISEYVDAMSPGWNLGNSLDATDGETSWGNPSIKKELISAIKESGYNSIRVPLIWNKYIDKDNNIDRIYMNRVKEVVDWCLEEDFYVMINLHHDS